MLRTIQGHFFSKAFVPPSRGGAAYESRPGAASNCECRSIRPSLGGWGACLPKKKYVLVLSVH